MEKRLANLSRLDTHRSGTYNMIVSFNRGKIYCALPFIITAIDKLSDCRIEVNDAYDISKCDEDLLSLYKTWDNYYQSTKKWYAGMTFFEFAYLSGWDSETTATIEYPYAP